MTKDNLSLKTIFSMVSSDGGLSRGGLLYRNWA